MDKDDLCDDIKENLANLGISRNRTLSDISYLTIDGIRGLYRETIRKGHVFYFQNEDLHKSAKKSYMFFVKLFQQYGANSLGDIIPREYQTDLIGDFDRTLVDVHRRERAVIEETITERKANHIKMAKDADRKKLENYNDYYTKDYIINKKVKELKRKNKQRKLK